MNAFHKELFSQLGMNNTTTTTAVIDNALTEVKMNSNVSLFNNNASYLYSPALTENHQ